MTNDFVVNIYSIPEFKGIPKERILKNAEKMVNDGVIEWVDKDKGLIRITNIGIGVREAQQPSNW